MYRMKSGGMDAVVTDNHRWYMNTKTLPSVYTPFTTKQIFNTELVPLRDAKGRNDGQWNRKSGTTTHINHKIPTVGHNTNVMYEWPDCPFLPRAFVTDEACNLDWCRFVGLVMGDGSIGVVTTPMGRQDHIVKVYQSDNKPEAMAYIVELMGRLAARIPGFSSTRNKQNDHMYTFIIKHRGIYDFFLPMIRGPQSYDPLNDAMCKAYQAPHHRALARSGTENVLACPEGWVRGKWWHLRRWFFYLWLFLLSRNQARAMIKGIAAADGEWSSLSKARGDLGGGGRGGGKAGKRVKQSNEAAMDVPLVNRGYVMVMSSSIPLVHDLAVLGHLADTRVHVGIMHKKGEFMPSIGARANANGWYINFAFADSEQTVACPKPELYVNPHHDGFVYCLTVPNSNFLARRCAEWDPDVNSQVLTEARQKPFFTGNVSHVQNYGQNC
jgi:DNA-directed RNA polymerase I subunit RPA2